MSRHSKRNPELYEINTNDYNTGGPIDYPDWIETIETRDLIDPVIGGIDTADHPDYADAYLESASIVENGPYGEQVRELDDDELNQITEAFPDWIYEMAVDQIN